MIDTQCPSAATHERDYKLAEERHRGGDVEIAVEVNKLRGIDSLAERI